MAFSNRLALESSITFDTFLDTIVSDLAAAAAAGKAHGWTLHDDQRNLQDGPTVMDVGYLNVGGQAKPFGALSEPERRAEVLRVIDRAFGPSPAPLAYVDRDWSAEQWSAGCYVGLMPPGLMTRAGEALRRPCGRIHFAGTETATRWAGYIDGAIESGERAASETLKILLAAS